jgi:hypothetical protein
MEAKYVTIEEGFNLAAHHKVAYLNCEPRFINIICETFKLKPVCLIVYSNNKPLIGLVLYTKNKSIVHPTNYIYTAIWKTSNSSIAIENALIIAIKELQKKYRFINLLLPPNIIDIRPFIYCGFKSDVKYTYVNNLLDIKLSSDVKSMRNRANKLGIQFDFNTDSNEILNQNIASFFKLGYKKKYIKRLERFILNLKNVGYLIPISARLNNILLASGYVLLDKENFNAMNLFITSDKENYQTGVHSSLYLYNLYWLKDNGFLTNDLFGATTKGIGNFKSNFNGDLTPYYHVRYNFIRWSLVKIINNAKSLLKKVKPYK